ncbi:MAG: dihydropteroate synthase, partial [Candidatus Wildermuthbacteria bacterium]|nr:dihydropteroate synthase [Candidatus Wildermuthbacteria bacterium]
SMQENPAYADVVQEIKEFFKERIQAAKEAGVEDIILDPGIGFGKTVEHNLQILKRLGEFKELGYPILVGTSRKSFIGKLNDNAPVEQRLEGSLASMVIAIMNGATMVRVHDVKPAKKSIQIADAIKYIG